MAWMIFVVLVVGFLSYVVGFSRGYARGCEEVAKDFKRMVRLAQLNAETLDELSLAATKVISEIEEG